jgi:four helix bundle protein
MTLNFGFEELELWQKVRSFKNDIRKLSKTFPSEEKFRLTDQVIRSSRAFNASLSEGHGRLTYSDQINYCIHARGSLSETINHLIDALDDGYIEAEQLDTLKSTAKEIERMLNGYLGFLRKKKDAEK